MTTIVGNTPKVTFDIVPGNKVRLRWHILDWMKELIRGLVFVLNSRNYGSPNKNIGKHRTFNHTIYCKYLRFCNDKLCRKCLCINAEKLSNIQTAKLQAIHGCVEPKKKENAKHPNADEKFETFNISKQIYVYVFWSKLFAHAQGPKCSLVLFN